MSEALARLNKYVKRHPAGFEPSDEIEEMASSLPPEVGALMGATYGCEIDFAPSHMVILSIDDVLDLVEGGSLEELPGVVPIATDGAQLFVLDAEGVTLGAGEVWGCAKDELVVDQCQQIAPSLERFLTDILDRAKA